MARFGFQIEKRMAFRGGIQHFANVYYYEGAVAATADTTLGALLDFLVTQEQSWHSPQITFTYGRCWSQVGTAAANEMIVQKALTGVGTATDQAGMDRERAILFQWPAGKDVKGRPVYLRKWYHTHAPPGGVAATANQLEQLDQLTTTQRNTIATAINQIRTPTVSSIPFTLCAKTGRFQTGPGVCHPYLEHHQLGEEWRG